MPPRCHWLGVQLQGIQQFDLKDVAIKSLEQLKSSLWNVWGISVR